MAECIEHELCANCKKEIPQANYVMHTVHCARNITLCTKCKEPVPKNQFAEHKCIGRVDGATQLGAKPKVLTSNQSVNAAATKNEVNKKEEERKEKLIACKYCEIELTIGEIGNHEEYCGARTDKCNECGEIVMFKYKKLHEDSNHGFLKLNDEPGPKASWDSNSTSKRRCDSTTTSTSTTNAFNLPPLRASETLLSSTSTRYNMTDYLPSFYSEDPFVPFQKATANKEYKDMTRRLDCKAEYIKNLLHDSASITAPIRSSGLAPRNHFNHNKGPAPKPPSRRMPPSELLIPCEFCDTPIPHEELILHQTGCRPDLTRSYRRRRIGDNDDDDYFEAPQQQQAEPASPDVELPCEFCADMIPASQLLRHQATCN